MSHKKWYKNIPSCGVLVDYLDSIIRIMSYDDGCVIDDYGERHSLSDIGYMRALTAAEWWEFAPWQDMKDAPQNGCFLVIENCTGEIKLAKRYLDDEFIDEFNHRIVFKKWLPLPPQVI